MTDPKRAERIAKLRAILALTNSDQPGEASSRGRDRPRRLKRRWGIEDAELEEGDCVSTSPVGECVDCGGTAGPVAATRHRSSQRRHISPDSIRRGGLGIVALSVSGSEPGSRQPISGTGPSKGRRSSGSRRSLRRLTCLVVPTLGSPCIRPGQTGRSAARRLMLWTACSPQCDASSLPRMGDLGAFREYLVAHPFPDRWLESDRVGRIPERRGVPAPDIDIPRTATIWAADSSR